MLRSMYTSIGGLKAHQSMLDVVANNIANVNTFGFKSSRTTFADLLSQTISGTSAPNANMGGTNAKQVGLGSNVASIQQMHTQGNVQNTAVPTDLAINGDGFFRVTDDGALIGALAVPFPNYSYMRAGDFVLDANGDMVSKDGFFVVGFAEDALVPGTPDPLTEIKLNIPPATTESFSIGQDGMVTQVDTAGAINIIGWVTIAKFANPGGLQQVGGNKWERTTNSGAPVADVPGFSGTGVLVPGAIEMSNVDLAAEFTEMIKAQRGFQANSRTITTSDEILQELVNLKR